MCKIFLANSFVWGNNRRISYLLCRHEKYKYSGLCNECNTVKKCITLKRNLQIDWKFGHNLILSISTEQCHKNNISKSRNGPLNCFKFEHKMSPRPK